MARVLEGEAVLFICSRGHRQAHAAAGKRNRCMECQRTQGRARYRKQGGTIQGRYGRVCASGHTVAGDNALEQRTGSLGWRCRACTKVYADRRNITAKAAVIEAYGGCCACCGETEPDFLCLDHVNGDGAEERIRLYGKRTGNGGGGYRTYALAIREGFPARYRLLCFNCNFGVTRPGGCAHQRTVSALLTTAGDQH